MKKFLTLISAAFVLAMSSCGNAEAAKESHETTALERAATPDYLTLAADSLWAQAAADSIELHSMMIVNDGKVVYEAWRNGADAESKHVLNSVSKTFTSIAVGMAVAEGKLAIDEKLVDIFPEYAPETVSENLAAMDVRSLLTMTCGHATDHTREMRELAADNADFNWVRTFMSFPVEYRPGMIYCYNSVGTLMLSAIVQKRTGQNLVEYLLTRLFEPLGIRDVTWETVGDDICCGGWGLYLSTEDLAKTGQLLLQEGSWCGKQLLPAEWVAEMSKMQVESSPAGINLVQLAESTAPVSPDWIQGYGYQMWMCRHNAFRADGAGGQYILVIPELNSVLAMTARTDSMQEELNLVWRYIYPALSRLNNSK